MKSFITLRKPVLMRARSSDADVAFSFGGPLLSSLRIANNTERIMRYWRYSRIKRIRITFVRIVHHFVHARCIDPPEKKKNTEQKVALPELSQTQITKLKHLSLLSYAMQQRVILTISFSSRP